MIDLAKPAGLSGHVTYRTRDPNGFPVCAYGRGEAAEEEEPCMNPSVVRIVLPEWHRYWTPRVEMDLCVKHAHLVTRQERDARADAEVTGYKVKRGRVRWGWWTTTIGGWAKAEIDALRSRGYPGVVTGTAVLMHDQVHRGKLYSRVVYEPGSITLLGDDP